MELRNGHHIHFIAYTPDEKFIYRNGTYVIDNSLKYYDISSGLWCLDYHEDIVLPIQRKIDVNHIKGTLEMVGVTDTESAINPSTLERFIKSEVIQKVLKGAEMDEIFKFLKLMVILILVVCIIHFIIFLKASGVLSNLKMPFG